MNSVNCRKLPSKDGPKAICVFGLPNCGGAKCKIVSKANPAYGLRLARDLQLGDWLHLTAIVLHPIEIMHRSCRGSVWSNPPNKQPKLVAYH